MKRFAFLSFSIAMLIAPIQVQAQQYIPRETASGSRSNLTRKQKRGILLSHPNIRVCPGPNPDLEGPRRVLEGGVRWTVQSLTRA